ncbi:MULTISPECIES: PspC domain-containing protein [Chryseobacterium]|uniref:Phage shock protein PspC (Stress-responsive transcriptional regulator) n=1 Tax=Chryseobacterium camelliae TaxID=1265445 RepID=A0ABU0TJN8_9FLAO|nr:MULTISPECIES: PspC domain-containing protein [Chryseobacterium]MDT3409106.1 phage shock protein PspC (stress-responsive transcriptional regulator) [Pseudacidovorax intermedius]MDQ1097036.1 phage shock protein PspC (stress-responsive transcriptional regulator) [Chryseobacterium camelliae]MDQ1100974.1 phage shock protein PspC (stress-responsive transcriptional regulator) [Chryseobacterium sp. SORGH_AS_1048]MDR6084416.1 phage shock protein PspC (stress-responsive transcriptional regulator) [Chr
MNKTLSIGLAGFSFTIEEHAYIKLSDYLNALRSSLDAAEADEVMHDIEIRMVEIFRDSMSKREVINDTDVERVIAQIGTPEKIEEQEEAYYSEKNTSKTYTAGTEATYRRQLFRDPERQKIAGVCAGLAHYVGMDITAMRAIWLGIFILGIFTAAVSSTLVFLLYVILWAVLPKAETAADFLKMKGKPMNFDNLKNESNKLVQFANESTQRVGEIYIENKPYINNAGNGIWNVLKYIIGGIFVILAVGSIVGTFVLFGLFGINSNFPGANEIRFFMDDDGMDKVLVAIMIIGCLIPAIIFSLLSIKIFSPKTKLKNIGWVLGALFLALITLGSYFGVSMAKREMIFKGHKEDTEEIAINTKSDTLYVDVKQVTIPQNFTAYDDDLYSDKASVYHKDWIHLDVTRKADVKTPYLIIKKEAKGYNLPLNVSVPVDIINNRIVLPNYIKYPYEHRFRDYNVDYELVLPLKTVVIPAKNDGISFDGDLNADGINDHDQDTDEDGNIKIEKDKITVNGSTIEYNSDDKDSIIINGKKVPESEANKVMDSIKTNIKKSFKNGNVDIKLNEGKNEISIKTK